MAELNNTIVRGNLRVVSQMEAQEILESGTSLINKFLTLSGGTMAGIIHSKNILPAENNFYDLGSSSYQFNNIYGKTIYENGTSLANKYLALSGGSLTGTVSITKDEANLITLKRTAASGGAFIKYFNNNQTTNNWQVGMASNNNYNFNYTGNTVAYIDTSGNIVLNNNTAIQGKGTNGNAYNLIHVTAGDNVFINGGGLGNILTHTTIRPDSTATSKDVGSSTYPYASIYGTTIYENGTALSSKYLPLAGGTMNGTITSQNIVPSSSNSYSLGSSSYFYSDIFSFATHTDRITSNLWNVVTFIDEEQEVSMATIGNTTPPGEQPSSSANLSYIMIGSGLTYKHEDAWTELRMSCANSMESDYEDYITIRTNGRQAGAVLYLPGIGSGDEEILATTSDIPSVLPAAYVTTPPSSNNNVGIKFVLLNSQTYPESSVTKRNGYIYMWY